MKRLIIFLLPLLILNSLSAKEPWMGHRVLVAYYSRTGNTERMAEQIAMLTGGDLFRIEPAVSYSDNKDSLIARAKEECVNMKRIELKNLKTLRLEEYDIVFIGSPVWFGTWAAPAMSLAMDERLEGKTIFPFMNCGGECGDALQMIGKYATRSEIRKGVCFPKQKGDEFINREIRVWLTETFQMKTEGDLTQMNVFSALMRMKIRYPKMTLCDVYKSFYQDFFGPGHIIESKQKAQGYIKSELKQVTGESVGTEKCGALGRYVRVDLWQIKNGSVKMNDYVTQLMNSVQTKVDTAQWIQEWTFVMNVIEASGMRFDNMQNDIHTIESRWATGKYGMHHSKIFDEVYHPHYRIIKKSLL